MYHFLLKDHHSKTSLIAYLLGKEYGLNKKQLSNLVLALLFARIVDAKSSWTTTHSLTVSALAKRLGEMMNFSPEICFNLKIAIYY